MNGSSTKKGKRYRELKINLRVLLYTYVVQKGRNIPKREKKTFWRQEKTIINYM